MIAAQIDQSEAAREILRRRRARSSLVNFTQSVEIPGAPISEDPDEWIFHPIETTVAKHHIVICEKVEECIRTDYGRLIIMAPPGSAKSTYAAVVAPAWAMGTFPGLRVLMTSYAAKPIERASRRMRQLCKSKLFRNIWPTPLELVKGQESASEWELTNGSGLFAAGLLGGITSSRCDLGIIDDPVAGREEADSETMRSKTRQAYDDDFTTRLKPKASIILIQTRWHQADLAGSILPEDYKGESGPILCRDGQVWEVLNIQAECERKDDPLGRKIGEMLWGEWFTERHWSIYRKNARTWNSLYQQRPTAQEGGLFSESNFHRYDEIPTTVNIAWYGSSDWAVTKKMHGEDPDFTEHGIAGISSGKSRNLYLEEGWSGQTGTAKSVKEFMRLRKLYDPVLWLTEKGVIANAVSDQLDEAMEQADEYVIMEYLHTSGDKTAMCAAFAGRVEAGKVYVKNGKWGDRLIAQLCAFPFGPHDDMVDMCGLLGRKISQMAAPQKDEPVRRRAVVPFSAEMAEAYDEEDEEQERKLARFKG